LNEPEFKLDAEGAPVFAEPWHAHAFALAIALTRAGHFTGKEWASTLASELKAVTDRGEVDDGTKYYEHWLTALERIVTSKGLTDVDALSARKERWADAYRQTPHGQSVELRQASATHRSRAEVGGHP
jgi:nitrile hydratase accessory protein